MRGWAWVLGATVALALVGCDDDDPGGETPLDGPPSAMDGQMDAASPDAAPDPDARPADGAMSDTSVDAADPDAGPEPDAELPQTLSLGDDQQADPCAEVRVEVAAEQGFGAVQWMVEGIPVLALERDGDRAIRFRAPVFSRDTTLTVRASAELDDGTAGNGRVRITVAGRPPPAGYPAGLALDCAPFVHGVAAGDPTPDGIILWTRLDAPAPEAASLGWVVARDAFFEQIAAEGDVDTVVESGHTARVEIAGLDAATTYYYRFTAPDGARSTIGRFRTAPVGSPERVRMAVTSCSSLFSGFFNGYRRMAERELDLVLHVGDYVYDFVDEDEPVRVPDPPPPDPSNTAEWRARHQLYLTDPDLRIARAAHAWVVLWDNHDINRDGDTAENAPAQVFREYVPMRQPTDDYEVAYRTVDYGDLMRLVIIDALQYQGQDGMLGAEQWAFLDAALDTPAAWRVIGTQKLISTLIVPGGALDVGNWDNDPASRTRFIDALGDRVDNVVLSGDLHFLIAADLVDAPNDPERPYDPATGERAKGVELLAAGMSRGNFDETICSGLCDEVNLGTIDIIANLMRQQNPHIAGLELIQHGYGVLDIDAERVRASVWFSVIREQTDEETLGAELTAERGAGRWTRP